MYMDNPPEKSKMNKRVLAFGIFLIVWPMILIFVSLSPIYGLVGADVDKQTLENTLNLSQIGVSTALYGGPVSILGGIFLLAKKLRK